jgi:hypothetical protein
MTSPEPTPPPKWLLDLQDYKARLKSVLEVIEVQPEELDQEAVNVHTGFVIPAYKTMTTNMSEACGKRWDDDGRQRFRTKFDDAITKWPAYKGGLAVLALAPKVSTAEVDALMWLEKPRRSYIETLVTFYGEFSDTLNFLFPP